MKKTNTSTITQIALFTALLCIISPFAIAFPFSPVPVSLSTGMLYISVYVLGKKKSVISCGIYLLIGSVGLPVFSGFAGGVGKVLGPTGGYMLGYLFLVYISGWFVERWNGVKDKKSSGSREMEIKKERNTCVNYLMQGFGMALGTVVCYLLGTFWLAYQSKLSFQMALTIGVVPFLIGDVVKICLGVLIGTRIRKRLMKAGMI